MKCNKIIEALEELSPKRFACSWDNVGLMVGSASNDITKILVVLDCDDSAIEYAIENGVDMIVSHHPLIFGSLKKVNDESLTGRRVLKLIQNGITVYSMHTNFDIKGGMASLAADYIDMKNPQVLEPEIEDEGLGRWGVYLPMSVLDWANKVKSAFGLTSVNVYGDLQRQVTRVAIAPGSGKDSVFAAVDLGIELVITGDVGHHTGIDAVAQKCAVIDAGHYGIEHIFINFVSEYLGKKCDCKILEMPKSIPCTVV